MNHLEPTDQLERLEDDLGPRLRTTFQACLADRDLAQARTPHNGDRDYDRPGNNDLGNSISIVSSTPGHHRPGHHRPGHHRRWSVAAALALIAGSAGAWFVSRSRSGDSVGPAEQVAIGQPTPSDPYKTSATGDTGGPADATTTSVGTGATEASSSGNASADRGAASVWTGDIRSIPDVAAEDRYVPPWDPIPVAPGTIGWFEGGANLPAEIATLRSESGEDPTFLAGEFRCRTWSISASTSTGATPTCTELSGGNGVEQVQYGDRLGIGVQLGNTSATEQLWRLAQGNLWGHEEVNEPPDPTVIDVAGVPGYSYRVGDRAYLAWEFRPEVVVWIRANGLDDAELASIAAGVTPVQLPSALPLPLEIEAPPASERGPASIWAGRSLVVGYLDRRPCVTPFGAERCASPDRPALLADQDWLRFGEAGSVSAIAPQELDATLRLNVYQQGWIELPLTAVDLGFGTVTWRPGGERLLEAQLVDARGTVIAQTGTLQPLGADDSATVAEGRTERAWIVKRQTPGGSIEGTSYTPPSYTPNSYTPGSDANADVPETPYCLLLFGDNEFTPLCPPADPPASGFGRHADYHEHLDLVEIAADVRSVRCEGAEMPIFDDPQLDGRRFAVTTCDEPVAS